jgi:hypothetical protein
MCQGGSSYDEGATFASVRSLTIARVHFFSESFAEVDKALKCSENERADDVETGLDYVTNFRLHGHCFLDAELPPNHASH